MKIPRDINSQQLIRYLKPYGYSITRQTGSHIRLTTDQFGQHHITVPNHDPIKIGTLSAILADVAIHLKKSKDEFLRELFG
jgi:predicted RNA binding protein YcfA (HicA-like mRNA interferase family)